MELIDRIGCRLKLQDLHVLLTVVQAGSMGKAAQHLNSTQPNVSRSIAHLEHAISARLLDRRPNGIELTDCGRALLNSGTAAFDDLRQGVKIIQSLLDPATGEVRIGCNPFLAAGFVSTVVDQVLRTNPRIICHLAIDDAETLIQALGERKLDFLITRKWTPIADERLDFEVLFEDSFAVVTGAKSRWTRQRQIKLAELVDESWVLPPADSGFGSVTLEAFRSCGLSYPRTSIVAIAPDVRINLLSTGRYLTIFPASALDYQSRMRGLRALPVDLPMPHVVNGVITLKNRTVSPAGQLVLERARKLVKKRVERNT